MSDYYNILELEKDATQKEIKIAYFKKVRQYPPDKEPDKFKEIREAYEILSDEETKKEYDQRSNLPKMVLKALDKASYCRERGWLWDAISIYEEILDRFGRIKFVEIALGETYLQNENSGKAIELFKKMAEQEPDNPNILNLLASAYSKRGWYKKGVELFGRLLEEGASNKVDILFKIAMCYFEANKYSNAKEYFVKVLECEEDSNIPKIEIYFLLLLSYIRIIDEKQEEEDNILEEAKNYFEQFVDCLSENIQIIVELKENIIAITTLLYSSNASEGCLIIDKITNLLDDDDDKNQFTMGKKYLRFWNELNLIERDENISDLMFDLCLSTFKTEEEDFDFEGQKIFISIRLEIIDKSQKYKKEFLILKKEYPFLFSYVEDFYNEIIRTKNIDKLFNRYVVKRNKLLKQEKSFYDKIFFDKQEDFSVYNSMEQMVNEDFEIQEPYVREQPKVGRNDKCPCGSGKKYKHCCGR